MRKVAHICTSSVSHKILMDKLSLLQKKGYEIHLISSADGYDEDFAKQYPIKLHFVHMERSINLVKDLNSIINMIKLLRKEKYDIVHTHTAKAGLIGRIAGRLSGVPLVIHTSHGLPFYEGQNKLKYSIYRFLEKVGSWFCDAIASQNKEDMKKIREYAPRNKPIFYEGNGVDINLMDEKIKNISKDSLKELKRNLNINHKTKVILVGARFELVKGHFFLLKGLKKLKESYSDFVCLLAGKGPLEQEIHNKIKEYNLEDHVKIIGHQTNIYPYIMLADIVALTSEKEGIPRILMESMAFSKPVVATDVLGTRELVRHKETGELVPYGNVDALSKSLYSLLNDENKRKEYGFNGRNLIEQQYTEQIVVERIDSIYKEMANRKKLPLFSCR
jgi:glycosyltransferase involved in cell wall biosynthesis